MSDKLSEYLNWIIDLNKNTKAITTIPNEDAVLPAADPILNNSGLDPITRYLQNYTDEVPPDRNFKNTQLVRQTELAAKKYNDIPLGPTEPLVGKADESFDKYFNKAEEEDKLKNLLDFIETRDQMIKYGTPNVKRDAEYERGVAEEDLRKRIFNFLSSGTKI